MKDRRRVTEEVERAAEDVETDVTDERSPRHDSEAGDTLTPSPHAQRQATDPHGPEEGGTSQRPAR